MTDKDKIINRDSITVLQNRWKICKNHIVYYGIRKAPYTFKNSVRLLKSTLDILRAMDGKKTLRETGINFQIKKLIRQKIVVLKEDYKKDAEDFASANFCKNCVANDYLIPGLELDEDGLCPMCASREKLKKLKSVLPLRTDFPHNDKGKYDVAAFYTGGKDSTYLLYYLSKVKKLRVLALTWITEYMSDSAKESMQRAKSAFPDVSFISKKVDADAMSAIYAEHFRLAGNTCMCPSLAYVLFLETIARENVPYLVLGNEPVQMHNLLFNNISPTIAFSPAWQKAGEFFFNLGRILTFKRPLTKGKMQTYFTMRTLAKGTFWGKSNEGRYQSEQVRNVHAALKKSPELMNPFVNTFKKCAAKGNFPALVHIDFAEVADGYGWDEIKSLLAKKTGWTGGEGNKALHTSCCIEKCKEFTQLERFREMKSRTVPYSAIELSLAVGAGNVSREKALEEIENYSGFFGCEKEYTLMMRPVERDSLKK